MKGIGLKPVFHGKHGLGNLCFDCVLCGPPFRNTVKKQTLVVCSSKKIDGKISTCKIIQSFRCWIIGPSFMNFLQNYSEGSIEMSSGRIIWSQPPPLRKFHNKYSKPNCSKKIILRCQMVYRNHFLRDGISNLSSLCVCAFMDYLIEGAQWQHQFSKSLSEITAEVHDLICCMDL